MKRLLMGIFLGNMAIVVYGGLESWALPQFRAPTFGFTCAVLSITAAGLLLEEVLLWGRRQIPTASAEAVSLPDPGRSPAAETVQASVAPAAPVQAEEPLVVRYRLTDTINQMVRNHYDNRAISRGSMVATNQATQSYWNLANCVLVQLGLRDAKEHSLWRSQGSSGADLKYISRRLKVEDDTVSVKVGGQWEEIDLVGCHFL